LPPVLEREPSAGPVAGVLHLEACHQDVMWSCESDCAVQLGER
jgi:hypothetical protein